jgi:ureidoglycolate lyase
VPSAPTSPARDQALVLARPLTAGAFAPFGQVLMALCEEPHRAEFAARLENYRVHATLNMAFLRSSPASGPTVVRALERHPYSAQSFVPVQGTRYLVAVCPAREDGEPDLPRLAAFVAEGHQAVNYAAGLWHAPHAVLGGPGTFIMLRWDVGTAADTELHPLAAPVRIAVPDGAAA